MRRSPLRFGLIVPGIVAVVAFGFIAHAGAAAATVVRTPELAGFRKHIPSLPGWMRADSSPGRLYAASAAGSSNAGFVAVYDLESLAMIGEITNGAESPVGVAADTDQDLYVANASGEVSVYYSDGTNPRRTVMMPASLVPTDVTVDGRFQVFVSDASGGVVHFGRFGSGKKARLTNPALATTYGVAVDKHDDVFALGPSTIVEYVKGQEPGVVLGLGSLVGPNSLVFDRAGNLIVDDPGTGVVSVYAVGQTQPLQTVGVAPNAGRIGIDDSKSFLYLPAGNSVYIYDYPAFTLHSSFHVPGVVASLSGVAVGGSTTAGECKPHLGSQRVYNSGVKTPSDGSNFMYAESTIVYQTRTALCTISYSGLQTVTGMALDPADHLWAASYDSRTEQESLFAFDVHATGDVSPIQTITGGNTGLTPGQQYLGIASDRRGRVWVPHFGGICGGYLTAFADTANGNVPPIASIGTHDNGQSEGIYWPTGVAFDRHGNLWVSNFCSPGSSDNASVSVFTPPFSDTEKPVATWILPGNSQYAEGDYIAVDTHDDVWVGGQFNLDKFPRGLRSKGIVSVQIDGEAAPAGMQPGYNGSWEVNGIATDAQDRLFVANPESGEIDVLPRDATTYAPTHTITSPSWPYASPITVTIGE